MIERRVIRQKFQNFVWNEMHKLHVSRVKYSLPNLHKSSIPQKCIKFDNDDWRMSFAHFSFEKLYNKADI